MSSRAIFYKSIKQNWSFGQYLEHVNVAQHRKALCRLIVSSHRLRIERETTSTSWNETVWNLPPGCWRWISFRLCLSSLCSYPKEIYKAILLEETFNVKLVQLFNTENRKALKWLAKYVYQAFNLRNEVTRTWKNDISYPSSSFEIMFINDFGNCYEKFVVYVSLSNTCCYVVGILKL